MLQNNLYPYPYSLQIEYHSQTGEFLSIFNFQKNIGPKGGKVNRSDPQKVSRGHIIGSNWLKSSLIYSLHVILGTQPKFLNKTTLILLCH